MIATLTSLFFSPFLLGLATPLTAVCVLPLYPGYLVYLAGKAAKEEAEAQRKILLFFGFLITLGVIVFMSLLGLVFTTILEVSLTQVINIVSPLAFGVLLIISFLLIFDVDISRFLPRAKTPVFKNPYVNAVVFGFFFGAIVIPCSPLFIAALFATTPTTGDFALNMIRFVSFGVGIGAPLIAFSALSTFSSDKIIGSLVKYRGWINRGAGVLMLGISAYYLIFVFKIFG